MYMYMYVYIYVVFKKKFSYADFFYNFELFIKPQKQQLGSLLQNKFSYKLLKNSLENTCAGISFTVKFQPGGLQLY